MESTIPPEVVVLVVEALDEGEKRQDDVEVEMASATEQRRAAEADWGHARHVGALTL